MNLRIQRKMFDNLNMNILSKSVLKALFTNVYHMAPYMGN